MLPQLSHQLIYAAVAISAAGALLWGVRKRLRKTERKRKAALKAVDDFASVPTESPVLNPDRVAVKRGMESIERRFSVIRGLAGVTVVLALFTALIVPFLGRAPTVFVSFVLGTITVLAGIAGRPFVENIIAGLVISLGGRVRIGDTVLFGDHYGTVEDITLTYTMVKLWDWRRLILPNHRMLDKEFLNYSCIDNFIWAHVVFTVAPGSDLTRVEAICTAAVRSAPTFLDSEDPGFWVTSLDGDRVQCWTAGWTQGPGDAWALTDHVRRELNASFKREGIQHHEVRVAGPIGHVANTHRV